MNLKKYGCLLLTALFLLPPSYVSANEKGGIEVVYDKVSRQLLTTRDDFFSDFGSHMLPGDTYTDIAVLKNNSNGEIELFFKTQPYEKSLYKLKEDFQLLNEIQLTIDLKKDGEIKQLYAGTLAGNALADYHSLGHYEAQEEAEFIFTIYIPETLTNEYNMTKTQVKWIFAVNESLSDTPKTNDDSKIAIYILVFFLTVLILTVLLSRRKMRSVESSRRG